MSTLTKTLIILLTLSSIFLCGIVVTYVSNAQNFKKAYLDEETAKQTAQGDKREAERLLTEKATEFEAELKKLNEEIAELGKQFTEQKDANKQLQLEVSKANQTADNRTAVAEKLTEIRDAMQQTLDQNLSELKVALATVEQQETQLNQVNAELIAKLAIINTLQADKRRLEQATAQLQVKLDQLLGRTGGRIGPGISIDPQSGGVRPVLRAPIAPDALVKPIALKGTITGVDIQNSIAQISIGAASGVRPKMKFLVTRGGQFICEMLIIDIEPEKAVGLLQRVKAGSQPKIGDNVSTNL